MAKDELVRLNISRHLINFRTANKLTQSQMAKILNIKDSTYRSWETRSTPNKTAIVKISQITNISIDKLMGGNSNNFDISSNNEIYGDKYLSELSNDEKIIVMKYRQLNADDKKKIDNYIKEIQSK